MVQPAPLSNGLSIIWITQRSQVTIVQAAAGAVECR
jgi:hypothetical protein